MLGTCVSNTRPNQFFRQQITGRLYPEKRRFLLRRTVHSRRVCTLVGRRKVHSQRRSVAVVQEEALLRSQSRPARERSPSEDVEVRCSHSRRRHKLSHCVLSCLPSELIHTILGERLCPNRLLPRRQPLSARGSPNHPSTMISTLSSARCKSLPSRSLRLSVCTKTTTIPKDDIPKNDDDDDDPSPPIEFDSSSKTSICPRCRRE